MTLLAFVPDPRAVVREAARVLRPGGTLVVGALGRWSLWAASRRVRGWLGDPLWRGARFWSAGELRRMLTRAGLEVGGEAGAVWYPPLAWAARWLSRRAVGDDGPGRGGARRTERSTVGAAFVAVAARKERG